MKRIPNQIPIVPWRTYCHLPTYHLLRPHLKSGNHMNQQEEDMERHMLSSMESNLQNHRDNSTKKQGHLQQRKDQYPQLAKYPPQNTSLTLRGNQSRPLLPMSRLPLWFHPLPTYPIHHLLLGLLIGILLPSPSGTPLSLVYQNSQTFRSCVVATF